MRVDRDVVCPVDPASLPPDARFAGYHDVVVQELVVKTDNVRDRCEIWVSPTGGRLCGSLPPDVQGEFGPRLRTLLVSLKYVAGTSLHPRFREAVSRLERGHQSSKQAGEPVCAAILGFSGVGKTSVVDHYRRLHPPRETDTANCQPVLQVTLQPDARPKGIAADLLLALGDPAWSSGTVESLTNRAARLLQHCGVELIVLDEFHHLFDVDRAKMMTKASQWLQVRIVNTGLPVVVCGMPEAECVLSAEHTERRFKQQVLAQQSNPFIGDLDKATLDRVQAADQARTASVGLSPRASRAKRRPATATNSSPRCLPAWDPPAADSQPETDSRNVALVATTEFVSVERGVQFREARRSGWQ